MSVQISIGGCWTTNVQAVFPGVPTLMVEASTTHNKELEETNYKIAVLSSSDGETIDFFSMNGGGTGNSMFVEQTTKILNLISALLPNLTHLSKRAI